MPAVTLLSSRVARSSSRDGSPVDSAMDPHMNVRSFTSRLKTTSVNTGSSNWTKAQPASRSATSSSRRILTTSTARCSRVGYALSETPFTHIDRARMYGPGNGTMIGLFVCWRRKVNSSRASGRRGRILSTTVSFLMENAGASAA